MRHCNQVEKAYYVQPVVTVLASEVVVDWLKHAFITKFNHIRPSVYDRYMDVLCRDLASASAISHRRARKVGHRSRISLSFAHNYSIRTRTNHHLSLEDSALLLFRLLS